MLTRFDARREPFTHAAQVALPEAGIALELLIEAVVAEPAHRDGPPFRSAFHRKCHELRQAFAGQSELCFPNALLIAHLRSRQWPLSAPMLFQRL